MWKLSVSREFEKSFANLDKPMKERVTAFVEEHQNGIASISGINNIRRLQGFF